MNVQYIFWYQRLPGAAFYVNGLDNAITSSIYIATKRLIFIRFSA
ncbi:hypothetical protein J2Z65_004961 [Paenibacillus aceris]|uniref:Uncharacterized protein n=1 Tax=Paenibacillus aceris TaxID=869555 RepID=A0ABS4I470_9BACL|nr:hypothetical protein [Paenibacillus aceris]